MSQKIRVMIDGLTAHTTLDIDADYFPLNKASTGLMGRANLRRMFSSIVAAFDAAVSLVDGATIATDASLGNNFRVTLGGNRTLGNPTNAHDGQLLTWEIIQDGTGNRTLAYDTKFAFGTDITGATLTTTASKRDFLVAYYNASTDKFYVVDFKKGY